MAAIDKKFIINRQGKEFILYAGLLDFAHDKGLKSLRTELIQAPTEANKMTAICSAVALFEDGKQFTGIGDAAPNNVAPAMQTCIIRMAETRAKARAMRDAVNIGVAAFEELGDENDASGYPQSAPVQTVSSEEVESIKEAIDAIRKTVFARAKEMGQEFGADERGKQEARSYISVLLGRNVATIKELTLEDWQAVLTKLNNAQKTGRAA